MTSMTPPLSEVLKIYKSVQNKNTFLTKTSITDLQKPFQRDVPGKRNTHVCRIRIPADTTGQVTTDIARAIKLLGDGSEQYEMPESIAIPAEWVAARTSAGTSDSDVDGDDELKRYDLMMNDVKNDSVLIYAHGGAGTIGSAAASRPMVLQMAALTGGRVLSIDYRLSPQAVFPAQIMDYLLAYLFLISPPKDSSHAAVPPSQIVFVGESFGAMLALAVTQALLTLNRHGASYPLPAGLAFFSPYTHVPWVYPSWNHNKSTDTFSTDYDFPLFTSAKFPACQLWNTARPPRGDWCFDTSVMSHPLVCPSTALSWAGCPPLYMACGQERCIDTVKVIAAQAAREGVTVRWEEYEGMCHVWMLLFRNWWQTKLVFGRWLSFVKDVTGSRVVRGVECWHIPFDGTTIAPIEDIEHLGDIDPGKAKELVNGEKRLRQMWWKEVESGKWAEKVREAQGKGVAALL